jgi:hypothetical protein
MNITNTLLYINNDVITFITLIDHPDRMGEVTTYTTQGIEERLIFTISKPTILILFHYDSKITDYA